MFHRAELRADTSQLRQGEDIAPEPGTWELGLVGFGSKTYTSLHSSKYLLRLGKFGCFTSGKFNHPSLVLPYLRRWVSVYCSFSLFIMKTVF
jgi:hypothetical protein